MEFIATEGVYTLTEEHKPPPAHANLPSTQQIFPCRLSTVSVNFPSKVASQGFTALLGGNAGKTKEPEKKKGGGSGGYDDSFSSSEHGEEISDTAEADVAQHQTVALFSGTDASALKRKPTRRQGRNIRTTSSSFVTRLQSMENLSRHLSSKAGEVTFLFHNSAKNFFWSEVGSKSKDPLARITFSAHPTCHAVNYTTATHTMVELIIGFNTGDLMVFDAISSQYVRFNKGGCISSSPCTAVHWVPSSRSLFMVSHADGTIIVYDREREDSVFTPRDPGVQSFATAGLSSNEATTPFADPSHSTAPTSTTISGLSASGSQGGDMEGWKPLEEILVTPGPSGSGPSTGGSNKDKVLKNPVSHWRVSRKSILAFAFSPDVRHIAVGGEDGQLRLIDALSERLEDTYAAYFGSINCVSWSPDGRLILAGGQDDLLTIFAPFEQRVVARCQGHSSFVSGLAFDDLRCNGRTYRFASVGEDNKVILWDFSGGALHRPKLQGHNARLSLSSTISLALRRRDTGDMQSMHPSTISPPVISNGAHFHAAPSRNEVAVLQPVVTKQLEGDLLSSVQYLPTGLFTISRGGSMKLWARPLPIRSQRKPRIRDTPSSATTDAILA